MRPPDGIFKTLKNQWGDETGPMSGDRNSNSVRAYWVAANVCAFIVGIGVRLAIRHPVPNPILDHPERFGAVVTRVQDYIFHPVTYAVVVAFLVFRIVHLGFMGVGSVFFSFIAGGISATIVLVLWQWMTVH